jgi:hypothetical protein
LVANAGEPVSSAELAAVLWPTAPPDAASRVGALLRSIASSLEDLSLVPATVLRAAPQEIDARQFADGVREGVRLAARGERGPALARLDEALAIWRGDPYPELERALPAIALIDELIELRLRAIEERFGLLLAGRVDYALVGELSSAAIRHPERRRLRHQLALAHYRTGRQVEALQTIEAVRRDLADAPDTALLHMAILQQSPELDRGEVPSARPGEL